MTKNIVLYSDGTGQDGGARPEQRITNIYKMYRISRDHAETGIDPSRQVVFYDAGLGTDIGTTALRVSHLLPNLESLADLVPGPALAGDLFFQWLAGNELTCAGPRPPSEGRSGGCEVRLVSRALTAAAPITRDR
jgi:hypothetical protein